MWEIYERKRTARQKKKRPTEILKRYQKWKDIVAISGPTGLRAISGFNDESLTGQWQGHRSSRLNPQYRVNYRIEMNKIFVEVVALTAAHDYRRK
jgi:toxin HigB-1